MKGTSWKLGRRSTQMEQMLRELKEERKKKEQTRELDSVTKKKMMPREPWARASPWGRARKLVVALTIEDCRFSQ